MSAEETANPTAESEAAFGDTGYVGWGNVGSTKRKVQDGDKRFLEHVKLEEGTPRRLRLVAKPYKFWRHYDPIMAISPGFEQDVCWQAGHRPRERYAILVLDRTDENKLKILEGGPAIFNEFKSYFELTQGKDPGGKDGPDWLIKVEIPSRMKDGRPVKDKRQTKYHVMRDEKAPFTKEEEAHIRENWVELKDMKKPHTPEIIAEMFEDAKRRGDGDPLPGGGDWWKTRRAARENGDDTNDAPSGDDAPAKPLVPNPSKEKDLSVGDGFNALFDEDDGDKPNTDF